MPLRQTQTFQGPHFGAADAPVIDTESAVSTIGQAFLQARDQIDRTLSRVAPVEGQRAGRAAQAGAKVGDDIPPLIRLPGTDVFSQSFNQAAERAFLSQVDIDVRRSLAALSNEHTNDPAAMQQAFTDYATELAEVVPADLHPTLEQNLTIKSMPLVAAAQQRQIAREMTDRVAAFDVLGFEVQASAEQYGRTVAGGGKAADGALMALGQDFATILTLGTEAVTSGALTTNEAKFRMLKERSKLARSYARGLIQASNNPERTQRDLLRGTFNAPFPVIGQGGNLEFDTINLSSIMAETDANAALALVNTQVAALSSQRAKSNAAETAATKERQDATAKALIAALLDENPETVVTPQSVLAFQDDLTKADFKTILTLAGKESGGETRVDSEPAVLHLEEQFASGQVPLDQLEAQVKGAFSDKEIKTPTFKSYMGRLNTLRNEGNPGSDYRQIVRAMEGSFDGATFGPGDPLKTQLVGVRRAFDDFVNTFPATINPATGEPFNRQATADEMRAFAIREVSEELDRNVAKKQVLHILAGGPSTSVTVLNEATGLVDVDATRVKIVDKFDLGSVTSETELEDLSSEQIRGVRESRRLQEYVEELQRLNIKDSRLEAIIGQ